MSDDKENFIVVLDLFIDMTGKPLQSIRIKPCFDLIQDDHRSIILFQQHLGNDHLLFLTAGQIAAVMFDLKIASRQLQQLVDPVDLIRCKIRSDLFEILIYREIKDRFILTQINDVLLISA